MSPLLPFYMYDDIGHDISKGRIKCVLGLLHPCVNFFHYPFAFNHFYQIIMWSYISRGGHITCCVLLVIQYSL